MLTMLPQSLDPLMATALPEQPTEAAALRPKLSATSNSFPRLDNAQTNGRKGRRSRAGTLQNIKTRDSSVSSEASSLQELQGTVTDGDLFAQSPVAMDEKEEPAPRPRPASPRSAPKRTMTSEPVEELPIELKSLTDRFIDSLSAKVHPTPPTVDKLSELFQDFYVLAATHISTHISTLSSRQQREFSYGPSGVPLRKGTRPATERSGSEQQMITKSEIDDRKRARKGLEKKRGLLEEAVERKACEGVYDRIWRHRSTHDEEQDEKLRSKTAALGVVGIGLEELGIRIEHEPLQSGSGTTTEEDVRRWLGDARDELVRMNDERYPLGKLMHLKAAHKAIVDTLSRMHPSSSSADEILPTMIYTLITTPPEGINVISNLYFIQRFRAETKIDGEAAYCLTNLEAAITFLETVDLASLRADEAPSGPPKLGSRPGTPSSERPNHLSPAPTSSSKDSATAAGAPLAATSPNTGTGTLTSRPETPSSALHQRRLSHLLQQPTYALGHLGNASDAVINRADQSLKNIGNTLESSYNLLFGRLKERQLSGAGLDSEGRIVVPTTLDEARKLVSTSPPTTSNAAAEDDGTASGASSITAPIDQSDSHFDTTNRDPPPLAGQNASNSTLLNLIGGRHHPSSASTRDRSADSTRSGDSNKRAAAGTTSSDSARDSAAASSSSAEKEITPSPTPPSSSTPTPAAQSMRNLTNTLNPLNRLANLGGGGISAMRNFGRSASSNTATTAASTATASAPPNAAVLGPVADLTTTFPDLAPSLPPKDSAKVAPPIKKFMTMENPGDMRISEVLELLRDYRRLAGVLGERAAFA